MCKNIQSKLKKLFEDGEQPAPEESNPNPEGNYSGESGIPGVDPEAPITTGYGYIVRKFKKRKKKEDEK